MTEPATYFLTTAIDYPNSRPHIGTAFEKIGADVQARFRRMEGADVFFLMGNDENTAKVSKRAQELGQEPKPYVDDMAAQFKEVWSALDISFDDFIQTSEARHHVGCRKFIQAVYDAGDIDKGSYKGLYCEGCEEFKTAKEAVAPDGRELKTIEDVEAAGGCCPNHPNDPAEGRRGGELLLQALRLPRPPPRPLRGPPRVHPAREPPQRDRQPRQVGPPGRLDHPEGLHLGDHGPVRRGADDLRLVRRPAELHHRPRLRQRRRVARSAATGRPPST